MKLNKDTQYIKSLNLKSDNIRSYDSFPFHLPFIRNFTELFFHPNVTYIIGENGIMKQFFENKDRLLHHLFQ